MKEQTEQLNSLLRGELSAVETYAQAMNAISSSDKIPTLSRMQSDHLDAVETLRNHISMDGGEPVFSSGPWGVWAKTVTGVAAAISEGTALKALKEGEEHGEKEYVETQETLDAGSPMAEFLAQHLIKQREHIRLLESLMAA